MVLCLCSVTSLQWWTCIYITEEVINRGERLIFEIKWQVYFFSLANMSDFLIYFFCMYYHDLKRTLDSKGMVSSIIKFQVRTFGWRVCITIVGTESIATSLKDWHLILAGINDLYNQTFSYSMKKYWMQFT